MQIPYIPCLFTDATRLILALRRTLLRLAEYYRLLPCINGNGSGKKPIDGENNQGKKMKETTTGGATYATTTLGRRISWPAVFAGLVIGLAIQVTLTLLGMAIGATTIDPLGGDTPGKGIAIGAGIYLLVTGLISTYVGACIASYLSGSVRKSDGVLHGLLSWGAATLVMALLVTSAVGGLIGGAMGVVGQAASGAAQGTAEAATTEASASGQVSIDADATKRQAQEASGATGTPTAQQQGAAEQKAREAGETAARATAGAALWSFLLLALGAGVAGWAGGAGRRERNETGYQPAPAR